MKVAGGGKVNFVLVSYVRHGRRGIQVKSFLSKLGHFIHLADQEFHMLLINKALKQNITSSHSGL